MIDYDPLDGMTARCEIHRRVEGEGIPAVAH
jgi:hypothetical protein